MAAHILTTLQDLWSYYRQKYLRNLKTQLALAQAGGDEITYQECEISYNEITTAIEKITELVGHFDEQGIYIDGVYDDIKNGRVIVKVRELDQEKENAIRSYVPYDFLVFQASENVVPLASIGPGSACYRNTYTN